jgi:hypothetical protein
MALLVALSLGACADTPASQAGSTTTPAVTETETTASETEDVLGVEAEGATSVDESQLEGRLADIPAGTITAEEADGLVWMREEEKLAHDVYVALYDMWGLRVFSNIAEAETTHTDAVKTLLDRYGLPDPAADNPAGVFTEPEIQALYDDLVAQGSESLVEALKVGALIEDLDIVDLQALQTDVTEVAMVYDNLERGSRNHLRAFISNLDRQGETYIPLYLTPEALEAIISAPMERGSDA